MTSSSSVSLGEKARGAEPQVMKKSPTRNLREHHRSRLSETKLHYQYHERWYNLRSLCIRRTPKDASVSAVISSEPSSSPSSSSACFMLRAEQLSHFKVARVSKVISHAVLCDAMM